MARVDSTLHVPAFVPALPLTSKAINTRQSNACSFSTRNIAEQRGQNEPLGATHSSTIFLCAAGPPKLPPSTAFVRDTATGASILLVGCVHGSHVSADDVSRVLEATSPDAVILELCESRLNALRTVVSHASAKNERLSKGFSTRKRQSFSQLTSTFGGVGPAAVAFLLDTVYRLQTFSGVDPGIEFAEPIRRYDVSRIVCGDAPARDTVKRLFDSFFSPVKSVKGSWSSIRDIVTPVVFPPKGGINIATLFITDMARLAEMARLLLPVTVISTLISVVGNAGAAALDAAPNISGLTPMTYGTSGSFIPGLWATVQVIGAAYISVSTLRFMKVLISDRDQILTRSIIDTAARMSRESEGEVTLCAVVGLLHANGILRLLQDHNQAVLSRKSFINDAGEFRA